MCGVADRQRSSAMRPQEIKTRVSVHFGVHVARLDGPDRHLRVTLARHVAIFLCREECTISYPELGRMFGGRDHTTMMSACKKIQHRLSEAQAARLAGHRIAWCDQELVDVIEACRATTRAERDATRADRERAAQTVPAVLA